MNQLILGDNLEVMRSMPKESVDLIYLDPPFFSNRNYEIIWGDEGEMRSFTDRWSGGIDQYISWLKERVADRTHIGKSLNRKACILSKELYIVMPNKEELCRTIRSKMN